MEDFSSVANLAEEDEKMMDRFCQRSGWRTLAEGKDLAGMHNMTSGPGAFMIDSVDSPTPPPLSIAQEQVIAVFVQSHMVSMNDALNNPVALRVRKDVMSDEGYAHIKRVGHKTIVDNYAPMIYRLVLFTLRWSILPSPSLPIGMCSDVDRKWQK